MEDTLQRKDRVAMKFLHYFMTEKNYNPIILQGAEDEIWLENLEGDYKIVRIVSNYIHNNEQLEYDRYKTQRITSRIKRKTFSFKMKVLSIYTDLGDNVDLEKLDDAMFIYEEEDLDKYSFIDESFPDIKNKLKFNEEGMELFLKITNDINQNNMKKEEEVQNVFKMKKPYVTSLLVLANVLVYVLTVLFDVYDDAILNYGVYGNAIRNGEYYRLITGIFLHGGMLHLLFNCYALWIIGNQIESYMGKIKYIIIYLFSGVIGSLFSITFSEYYSIGASGAIFGLLGSMLYFGYHYRVYLGNILKNQIIPLIMFNLAFGFLLSGVDNFAHIGGLIGGVLITVGVGVKYKSTSFEMINGLIVTCLFTAFMAYMGIFMPR